MALLELNHFTEASIAASRIFQRIDRIQEIDDQDNNGLVPETIQGNIDEVIAAATAANAHSFIRQLPVYETKVSF